MKTALLTLTAVMIIATVNLSAGQFDSKSSRAAENLIEALRSDNQGVRMQGIYMAGKYGVSEATGALKDALKKNPSSEERMLIALSLHRIGSFSAMSAVKELSRCDENERVRNRCALLYSDYMKKTYASVE